MFILSSIAKKQIVAVTGLMLVGFILGHLAGNMFIYGGPEAFNGYARKLHSLGPILRAIEYALLLVFIVHIITTVLLVMENIKARGGLTRYAVDRPVGNRSWATRLMPYTGAYIFAFIIWHLFDFKFIDDEGPRSFINGQSQDIYGVVVNAFSDPIHSALYIVGISCLGLHLAHGIQSVIQSFGFNHPRYTPMAQKASRLFALAITLGFSSIPVYVLFVLK